MLTFQIVFCKLEPAIPRIPPAHHESHHLGDYCDVYLTHDSMSVRKAHNSGKNHLRNVVDYYQRMCPPHSVPFSSHDIPPRDHTSRLTIWLQKSVTKRHSPSSTPSPHPTPPRAKHMRTPCFLKTSRAMLSRHRSHSQVRLSSPSTMTCNHTDRIAGGPPPFPGMPGAAPGQFPHGMPPPAGGRGIPPMPPFPPGPNGLPVPPPGGLPFPPPPGGLPFPPPGASGAPSGFPGMPGMPPPPGQGFPPGSAPPPGFPGGLGTPGQDRR